MTCKKACKMTTSMITTVSNNQRVCLHSESACQHMALEWLASAHSKGQAAESLYPLPHSLERIRLESMGRFDFISLLRRLNIYLHMRVMFIKS